MPTIAIGQLARWHERYADSLRAFDPQLGRRADELLVLGCLARDALQTALRLEHAQTRFALHLVWINYGPDTIAAALSYTTDGALSRGPMDRTPYVYNVWSSHPGWGGALLAHVARIASGPIYLHPLNLQLRDHYGQVHHARRVA